MALSLKQGKTTVHKDLEIILVQLKVIVVLLVEVLWVSSIPYSWSADLNSPSAVKYVGVKLLSAVTPSPTYTIALPSLTKISSSCTISSNWNVVVDPSPVNLAGVTLLLLIRYLSTIKSMFLKINPLSEILFLNKAEVPGLQ